jgi:hypothetical protein
MRKICSFVLALIAALSIGWLANAQEPRGAIIGQVTDSSAALIPGATVTITQ